jgi:hypothetical protein
VVDVNLNLMTYYADTQFGGLNEIKNDDGEKITFLRWGRGLHNYPMASAEIFDRINGYWYFSPRNDGVNLHPDAVCTINSPRENFKADIKFSRPE